MLTQSEKISELAPALLKAQQAIGEAKKDATNPFFKSTYADLLSVINTVKAPLNDNGIVFLQAINMVGDSQWAVVDTMLLHESGEYLCASTPIVCAKQNDPQAFGSGITYAKRYGLQSLVGVPSADDDGEGAMQRDKPPAKKPQIIKPKKAITKQAFAKFIEHHHDKLKDFNGFDFDYETFKASVLDIYGKEPTRPETIDIIINGSETLNLPAMRVDKALKKIEEQK